MRDHGAWVALETGFKRGEGWAEARRAHLKRQPFCIACRNHDLSMWESFLRLFRRVVVHHIFPFHICRALDRGDLEYDPRNLVTLCRSHHWTLGHFSEWECYNPYVKHLALRFFGRPAGEIMSHPEWFRFSQDRRLDIRYLTPQELAQLRAKLDEKFPPKE